MPIDASSLNYVRLETNINSKIYHVDQIRIHKSHIYVLDKPGRSFLIFDITGKHVRTVRIKSSELQGFDLVDDMIYLLETEKGKMIKLDLSGRLIQELNIGFRGVQFVAFPGETFVFNTAGFATIDRNSDRFQLVATHSTRSKMLLPYADQYKGLKYYYESQFYRRGKNVNFISAFDNVIYKVDTGHAEALTKFDFGKYNMPDSVFVKGQAFDNFNAFPFVSELTNTANNDSLSFFKFSFSGKEGYLLTTNDRKKLIAGGVGMLSGITVDYSNVTPICSYNNKFVALIKAQAVLTLPSTVDRSKLKITRQLGVNTIIASDNPILLFYKLL
jgi:hypothetical protein